MFTATVGDDLSCDRITVRPLGSVYFSYGMLILLTVFGSGVSGFGLGASCAASGLAARTARPSNRMDRGMENPLYRVGRGSTDKLASWLAGQLLNGHLP